MARPLGVYAPSFSDLSRVELGSSTLQPASQSLVLFDFRVVCKYLFRVLCKYFQQWFGVFSSNLTTSGDSFGLAWKSRDATGNVIGHKLLKSRRYTIVINQWKWCDSRVMSQELLLTIKWRYSLTWFQSPRSIEFIIFRVVVNLVILTSLQVTNRWKLWRYFLTQSHVSFKKIHSYMNFM